MICTYHNLCTRTALTFPGSDPERCAYHQRRTTQPTQHEEVHCGDAKPLIDAPNHYDVLIVSRVSRRPLARIRGLEAGDFMSAQVVALRMARAHGLTNVTAREMGRAAPPTRPVRAMIRDRECLWPGCEILVTQQTKTGLCRSHASSVGHAKRRAS